MPETLRTPDEAFAALPDYPFAPNYHVWEGIRMHYVDTGSGPPVILLHGEPTWSFLYRKVIPPIVAAGYRCIAPDYIGFGKSDKPVDDDFYTYDMHVESVTSLLRALELSDATVVGQDWGGPIGLRFAVENPELVSRLVILNTGIFSGRLAMSETWQAFRAFVNKNPNFPVEFLMERSAAHPWGADVLAAYGAPYPSIEFKAGVRSFPNMVPADEADATAQAMLRVVDQLADWTKPTYVLFSTGDPIFSTRTGERFVKRIPGAEALDTIDGASHFLQEDQGGEVGRRIAAFLNRTDGD